MRPVGVFLALSTFFVALFVVLSFWCLIDPFGEQAYGQEATVAWSGPSFTILQIADTQIGSVYDECQDAVSPCSAANTTAFVRRLVTAVQPDLVVFTGDQVEEPDHPESALDASIGPVRESGTPYVFIFGNHDVARCSTWDYKRMRRHVEETALTVGTSVVTANRSGDALSLFFLDYHYGSHYRSGADLDLSHLAWFQRRSRGAAHSMLFLHVPPAEFNRVSIQSGVKQEDIDPARVSRLRIEDLPPSVRVVAVGHDHINDFCGTIDGVALCYAGGAGYTTYGKTGWPRRARVFQWHANHSLSTYKLLDTENLTVADFEYLAT